MLGDVQQDALLESEFADEYQDWLQGRPGVARSTWFDYPVRKLARAHPLQVERSARVVDVAKQMAEHDSGSALVVERSLLVGIFTERDLLERVVSAGRDPAGITVGEVMTETPEVLPRTATMAQALRLLARGHYRHVPLVDDAGAPCGMLSTGHLIGFVSDTFPKEIMNAPPETTESPKKEEGA
jgi:CBS domain-containing protein